MQHLLQGRYLFTGPTYRRKCKPKREQIGPYQVSICITVARLSSLYRRHFAQILKKKTLKIVEILYFTCLKVLVQQNQDSFNNPYPTKLINKINNTNIKEQNTSVLFHRDPIPALFNYFIDFTIRKYSTWMSRSHVCCGKN